MKILQFIKSLQKRLTERKFRFFGNLSDNKFIEEKSDMKIFADLGILTASIEHEIRTPLATIDNILHHLKHMKHIKENDERVNKSLNEIKYQTLRISAALQIIRLIRLSEPNVNWEKIRLEDFLKQTAKHIRGIDRNKIFFRFECKDSLFVNAQRHLLEMALENIFNNAVEAIKATKSERGVIYIQSYLDRENNKIVIKVRDNGCGIPKDLVSDVMNAGFSTKKKEKINSGLGLFVVSKIIKLHRGEISIIRNEDIFIDDKGITVSLILPSKFNI